MKKLTKLTTMLLTSVLILALTACSQSAEVDDSVIDDADSGSMLDAGLDDAGLAFDAGSTACAQSLADAGWIEPSPKECVNYFCGVRLDSVVKVTLDGFCECGCETSSAALVVSVPWPPTACYTEIVRSEWEALCPSDFADAG